MQELTDKNFDEEIRKDIPVIVDFWAGWCGPCRMIAPSFEELSKEYEGTLTFAKLNTEEYQEITMRSNIQGIPALLVFHKGEEVGRIIGALPKEMLKERIDEILKQIK